jgi:hypothetical protein
MSYFRVSSGATDVVLADLGYTVPASTTNWVMSNQFGPEDMQNSADLKAAIILTAASGGLDCAVNLDGSWVAVVGATFDGNDIYAAYANIYEIVNTVDNQRLVDGSDCSSATQLHIHDARYFTETELGASTAPSGASLIGFDPTLLIYITATNVQDAIEQVDAAIASFDLDDVYTNDVDGIMHVNGTTKPLDLRSNNVNDILISREQNIGYGLEIQNGLQLDVSANELKLGALAGTHFAQLDVRVLSDLYVDGNIIFVGSITDTTVSELNVTDANILLRTNATTGADAAVQVERGSSGADANLRWNETAGRWMAGLVGTDYTIALLEVDEIVTGVWEFQGGASTEPSFYLTQKAAAPSTNLGTANQIPLSVINGQLATYDKTNSRNKFLSVSRQYITFGGRDNSKTTNEYLRNALFTSNESSSRLIQNSTLVGISVDTAEAETWIARVRRNGVATNLYSESLTASAGTQKATLNVNFDVGDVVQLYCEGSDVNRPLVVLEFAYRY